MVISKNPVYNNQNNLIKVQLDLMTYDILCRYVLQPSSMVKMEHLGAVQKLISIIDPSTYENDPEKTKRVKFLFRALEARLQQGIHDQELVLSYVNGGLTFNIDFLDYEHLSLNKNEIEYVGSLVTETLKYRYLYAQIDNLQDVCSRFKTTEFTNRGNIVSEMEGYIDNIKTEMRRSKVSDNIVDMEFSLEDGVFENTVTDIWNIVRNPSRRLITGMQGLNEMLGGGFESGRFYMIMGISGVGKSLTLLNIIYQIKRFNAGYQTKDPTKRPCIVLLTMENSVIETVTRLFDIVNEDSLGMENYTIQDVLRILREEGQLVLNESSPINIVVKYKPSRSIDTSYLYDMADDLEDRGYEIICLVEDHIKRIRSVYNNPDVRVELGDIVNEMKNFAVEKDIPVISNTHLNREATRIVEDTLRKGNQDTGKMLGGSYMGESLLMLENMDLGISIAVDFDREGNKYITFNLSKMRDKMKNPRTYFAQPFAQGSTIRLVEDLGGIPQFKESLHAAPEMNMGSVVKISGASSVVDDIKNLINLEDDDGENLFSQKSYVMDENQEQKVVPPAIVFFDDNSSSVADIINDVV